MNKEKISTILLAHKNLIKSTLISTPVTLYSNYVKLIKLNGIIKLTLVNKIKLFSQIKSMGTLSFLLNHKFPP